MNGIRHFNTFVESFIRRNYRKTENVQVALKAQMSLNINIIFNIFFQENVLVMEIKHK